MLLRYSIVFKIFAFCMLIYLLLILYIKTKKLTFKRLPYIPRKFPLYQCKEAKLYKNFTKFLPLSKKAPINVANRILIISVSTSKHQKLILEFLNYFKASIRTESFNRNFLLELANEGRFSLIIFDDYRLFQQLAEEEKLLLFDYCKLYNVGIISFYVQNEVSEETTEAFTAYGSQYAQNIQIPESSPVKFVAKSSTRLTTPEPYKPDWTLFDNLSNATPILIAEDYYRKTKSVAILNSNEIEHIIIGKKLDEWIIKLVFLDSVIYMAPNIAKYEFEKFIQIDIDDIFVGQTGSRFLKSDVLNLQKTQKELRKYIDNFYFSLGFSGYFYRHGDEFEIQGDEELVANANQFLWFPHMWRHNHAHEYSDDYLLALMTQNRLFANDTKLNILPNYAISPQHSGVFPIHEPLYKAWHLIWNVTVTSTEEYPHLRPASLRRGFIHRNISVLPRQTCGLFTHTSFFHAYPEGFDKLHKNIFGGDLFVSVLMNKFSIFMTHQQNFVNDRLGSYSFINLMKFVKCWTNIHFKWTTPTNMAKLYFQKFPNERQLIYSNACLDLRQKKMLSINSTCNFLPNLIILGPQKTGSTALSLFLSVHPRICSNKVIEDSFEELHFFNGKNYYKGIEWYAEKFSNISTVSGNVVFEKTANYFDSELAPQYIKNLLPNVKLIVILSNPVDRAYSWYQHILAHNDSVTSNYNIEQIFMSNLTETAHLRQRCLYPGLYAKHLDRWLDYFSPSQLILIDAKRLRYQPELVMRGIFAQLNIFNRTFNFSKRLKFVPQKGFYCIIEENKQQRCLGKTKGRKYKPLPKNLLQFLENFYKKPNEDLRNLLIKYNFSLPSFLLS